MNLRPPEDGREKWWQILGIALPILGIVLILVGWWGASGTALVAEQTPYLISGGILGLGLVIFGSALFVRYALTRYMRFWLIRLIYEQRQQTDRQIEALTGSPVAPQGSAQQASAMATASAQQAASNQF